MQPAARIRNDTHGPVNGTPPDPHAGDRCAASRRTT
jgi:hypothetical protein